MIMTKLTRYANRLKELRISMVECCGRVECQRKCLVYIEGGRSSEIPGGLAVSVWPSRFRFPRGQHVRGWRTPVRTGHASKAYNRSEHPRTSPCRRLILCSSTVVVRQLPILKLLTRTAACCGPHSTCAIDELACNNSRWCGLYGHIDRSSAP